MRISTLLRPHPSYYMLSPLLAIWNRCGRKKGHPVTCLPITCLWLQYKKWYALKAVISAPGFSVPAFPVWDSIYVCVFTDVHTGACVSMTCCIDVHLFNLPLRVRTVRRKVKTPLSQAYDFFSSFLAVSGLVFTGCFICLIYVPCPDCCMGPACSSHMAVPHALMRCPISRNTNRVLRPSLWLYDVWTHKSFPETPDQGRSKPDQARGPSVYFRGGLFSVTWLTLEPYIKKEVAKLRGLELFSRFLWFSLLFPGREFYC